MKHSNEVLLELDNIGIAEPIRVTNGYKLIVYVPDKAVRGILKDLKATKGKLSDLKAHAIAGRIVAEVVRGERLRKEEIQQTPLELDLDYGIEETDDERTRDCYNQSREEDDGDENI